MAWTSGMVKLREPSETGELTLLLPAEAVAGEFIDFEWEVLVADGGVVCHEELAKACREA